jgi:hypothetical protein
VTASANCVISMNHFDALLHAIARYDAGHRRRVLRVDVPHWLPQGAIDRLERRGVLVFTDDLTETVVLHTADRQTCMPICPDPVTP